MQNQGLNTYQYPQQYMQYPQQQYPVYSTAPMVNINIPAPQQYPMAYPCYYPCYYPGPAQPQNNQPTLPPAPAPTTSQVPAEPKPAENKEPPTPNKNVTPLTDTEYNRIKNDLLHGEKGDRLHAIAEAINKKQDPRAKELIQIGLHDHQPKGVQTAALAAVDSIRGDQTTEELLKNIAQSEDKTGITTNMAATALDRISSPMPVPGQKLDVIAE